MNRTISSITMQISNISNTLIIDTMTTTIDYRYYDYSYYDYIL